MRNNDAERRLMEEVLDSTRLKPRCPFLREDEFFSGDHGCKCEAMPVNERSQRPLGLHELQLWCTDSERHKHCIYYKAVEITWDQLNEMTLDVADLLKKEYKIDGYQWNECLNFLRSNLSRSLDFHGYKTPGLGYVNWREVRKALNEKRRNKDDTSGGG